MFSFFRYTDIFSQSITFTCCTKFSLHFQLGFTKCSTCTWCTKLGLRLRLALVKCTGTVRTKFELRLRLVLTKCSTWKKALYRITSVKGVILRGTTFVSHSKHFHQLPSIWSKALSFNGDQPWELTGCCCHALRFSGSKATFPAAWPDILSADGTSSLMPE